MPPQAERVIFAHLSNFALAAQTDLKQSSLGQSDHNAFPRWLVTRRREFVKGDHVKSVAKQLDAPDRIAAALGGVGV